MINPEQVVDRIVELPPMLRRLLQTLLALSMLTLASPVYAQQSDSEDFDIPPVTSVALDIVQDSIAASGMTIVGGEIAPAGSADDIVSLQQHETHFCEGLVIAPRFILTNHHCQIIKYSVQAYGGHENLSSMTLRGTAKNVYTFGDYTEKRGDVAILEFDEDLGLEVAPLIPKPTGEVIQAPPAGTEVTIYGHGATSYNSETPSNELKRVTLPISSDYSICGFIHPREFCTIGSQQQGTAGGDSSGKVVNSEGSVVGIHSGAYGNYPGRSVVLANRPLRNWMENVVAGQEQPDNNVVRGGTFLYELSNKSLTFSATGGVLSDNDGMQQSVEAFNPSLFVLNANGYQEVPGTSIQVYTDGSFTFTLVESTLDSPATYFFFVKERPDAETGEGATVTINELQSIIAYLPILQGEMR